MEAVVFLAIFWIAPIFVGHVIGKPKGRAGWAWGLLLGWLGVIIVALLSPKRDIASEVQSARMYRECPFCKERMRRDASVCPHCHRESAAWTQKDGFWWTKDEGGRWVFLDESNRQWRRLDEARADATPAAE
jgi:hypothetical protein